MVSLRGNGATCANGLLCMPDSNGITSGVQSPMSAQVCINGGVCVCMHPAQSWDHWMLACACKVPKSRRHLKPLDCKIPLPVHTHAHMLSHACTPGKGATTVIKSAQGWLNTNQTGHRPCMHTSVQHVCLPTRLPPFRNHGVGIACHPPPTIPWAKNTF